MSHYSYERTMKPTFSLACGEGGLYGALGLPGVFLLVAGDGDGRQERVVLHILLQAMPILEHPPVCPIQQ